MKLKISPLVACLIGLLPAFAAADTVFVSNEKSNTISVLDSQTMQQTAEFNAGNRPRGITISPDGTRLYVCASDDDTVRVFDTSSYKLLYSLPSGPDPELAKLHPSGNPLYVSNEDDNLVTVVDVKLRRIIAEIPVGVEPEGMGVSPDGRYIVNTSETTNMAHFINTESYEIEHNVLVDQRPRYAHFTSDREKLYVSSEIGGTVSVIDPNAKDGPVFVKKISFAVPGIVPEALQPVGVISTSDGRYVFVALGPSNRIAVIDAKSDKVIDYLLVGQRVWQLALNSAETLLVSTNGNSNDVSFIDIRTLKVLKSSQVGRQP